MTPTKKSKIALLTGATGFVGSRLAQRLVADGWRLHLIIRPESSLFELDSVKDQLTLHVHDGTTGGMSAIVESSNPTIVFHTASLFRSIHEPVDIVPMMQSNITFGTQLLDAMAAFDVRLLVNTGTSWQHFENNAYSPVCLYASTKQAFETIIQFYVESASLKVITLKLFDTYGKGDPRPKLIPLLFKLAKTGDAIDVSPGNQQLDLVHIDDVVDAFCISAHHLMDGAVQGHHSYAISSKIQVTMRHLVELIERVTESSLNINWGKRPYRPREVMTPWTKGIPLPDWHPKTELEKGLKQVFSNA